MAAFVNSYDWRIQQDGDDLLICRNGHGYDEPCKWERYVPAHKDESYVPPADWSFATRRPASFPGAVPTGEPRTQENILAALDPIRIGAPPIPPGFVLVPSESIAAPAIPPGFVLVPVELLERAISELTADIGSANWGVIGDLNKILKDAAPSTKKEGE